MENLALIDLKMRSIFINSTLHEIQMVNENINQIALSESERVILEDIQSDIKTIKSFKDAEIMLDRLADERSSGTLLRIFRCVCFILGFIGGYSLASNSLSRVLLNTAASVIRSANPSFPPDSYPVIGSICTLINFLGSAIFGFGLAKIIRWLFDKICEKFFDIRFETTKQKEENYKLFLSILDDNIIIAKRAGNLAEAKNFEFIKERALVKLKYL